MKSFRQDLRKLLKSLASEINDFAVSRDFKGLRQVLYPPFSTSAFSARARDVETILSYQNFLLARILFTGKINRPGRMSARKAKFAAYVRVHGIDRLGGGLVIAGRPDEVPKTERHNRVGSGNFPCPGWHQ
jgi:hypothetical protein